MTRNGHTAAAVVHDVPLYRDMYSLFALYEYTQYFFCLTNNIAMYSSLGEDPERLATNARCDTSTTARCQQYTFIRSSPEAIGLNKTVWMLLCVTHGIVYIYTNYEVIL